MKSETFFKSIVFLVSVFGILIGYSVSAFAIASYTITATAGEHGNIDPTGEVLVNAGGQQTFTMNPDSGYIVDDVVINGFSLGAVDKWTFAPVEADHAIHVTFRAKEVRWVNITGTVRNEDGTSLCTLVLANGQYMFTCDEYLGMYGMEVPLNEDGEITLYCFGDGFEPFKKENMTSQDAADFDITLSGASPDSRELEVLYQIGEAVVNPDWVKLTGTVQDAEGTSLCTMVLANGQPMFTCDEENEGRFDLEVPLNENGEITLFVFCDGFLRHKTTFKP